MLGFAVLAVALAVYIQWQLWPVLSRVIDGRSPKYAQRGFVAPGQLYEGPLTGNDFKHIYLGTQALWRGENPYDPTVLFDALDALVSSDQTRVASLNPFVYPPFTGFALGWLLWFSYSTALVVWFFASHTMMWLAAAASLWALGLLRSWRAWALAAAYLACDYPLMRNMSAGQLNAPLALIWPLFFLTLRGRRDWLAGLIGAAAAWFKLSPGILILYLLWTRRWRAAGWMALWSLLLFVGTVIWAGWDIHLDFLPLLRDMGYGRSTWAQFGVAFYCDPANQSFNSLFHHLFTPSPNPAGTQPLLPLGAGAANGLTWTASLALISLALWRTWPPRRANAEQEGAQGTPGENLSPALGYGLFVFLSLFLPSLCWDHYFIQLLFPILAVFAALERKREWMAGIVFAMCLLALNWPFNYGDDRWRAGAGLFLMSIRLWAALGIFFCAAWLFGRERRAEWNGAPNAGPQESY